jgi:hypothetical protein
MSTGVIAILLYAIPHQFMGLTVLGDLVFILNIIHFHTFCECITTGFNLTDSLQQPTEFLLFSAL